jgi:hypothetical protein
MRSSVSALYGPVANSRQYSDCLDTRQRRQGQAKSKQSALTPLKSSSRRLLTIAQLQTTAELCFLHRLAAGVTKVPYLHLLAVGLLFSCFTTPEVAILWQILEVAKQAGC